MRKKEQNKTAATRYRQKKKMEAALSASRMQELELEKNNLEKQEEDLRRQIKMVKQLLREIVSKKPNKATAASSISKIKTNGSIRAPQKARRK